MPISLRDLNLSARARGLLDEHALRWHRDFDGKPFCRSASAAVYFLKSDRGHTSQSSFSGRRDVLAFDEIIKAIEHEAFHSFEVPIDRLRVELTPEALSFLEAVVGPLTMWTLSAASLLRTLRSYANASARKPTPDQALSLEEVTSVVTDLALEAAGDVVS
jgi:hypothetical protein